MDLAQAPERDAGAVAIDPSFAVLLDFLIVSGLTLSQQLTPAHSSRGLGHFPLKEEIMGSNPICATIRPGKAHPVR